MGKNINYNEDHINGIIDKYGECIDELDNIEQLLSAGGQSVLSYVSAYYEGHGKEPAQEALKKTSEHISMLRQCCLRTSEYVAHSLEIIKEADSK